MKKSTYLLFALALVIFIVALYIYRKSFKEILVYTDLINKSHHVISGFEQLSNDLKAAQLYSSKVHTLPGGVNEIYKRKADSISADILRLRENVIDSLNKKRLDTIVIKVNRQLMWIRKSDVHDSMLANRAPSEMAELVAIQNLIDSSLKRAKVVLGDRRNGLESALSLNNIYILAFRVFSLIILFFTIVLVFIHARQKEKNRAFLDSILNSSQNGIISYKAIRKKGVIVDFKIVYANDAIREHTQLASAELVGKTIMEVSPQSKTNGVFEKFCQVTESNRKLRYEVTSGKNTYDVLLARFSDGVTASFFNITEMRKSGEDLKKKIQELEQSNYELEQYAYVASHDLQEPLRKIRIFGGLIRDKSGAQLDAGTRIYLQRLIDAAERMTTLINELLKFSRLFKPEKQFVQINLNEVLNNVLKDFDLMIQEKNVQIKSSTLPTIEANPLHMNQLFYNLIHNALKFSDIKEQPLLQISSRQLEPDEVIKHETLDKRHQYYEIVFKDNGIGFRPEFASQIFEIFKRLNEQHIYPGSGIGLSLCKKIILNHHGIIWAKGEEKEGASFHIILPAAQPNPSA